MQYRRLERLGEEAVHADIVLALRLERLKEGEVGPARDFAGEDWRAAPSQLGSRLEQI